VAMDESDLMAAFRYLASNPVKAKLVPKAADWSWSSTPAHLRRRDDGSVTVRPLLDCIDRFPDFLDTAADPERVAVLAKG
jgi:putative transposase